MTLEQDSVAKYSDANSYADVATQAAHQLSQCAYDASTTITDTIKAHPMESAIVGTAAALAVGLVTHRAFIGRDVTKVTAMSADTTGIPLSTKPFNTVFNPDGSATIAWVRKIPADTGRPRTFPADHIVTRQLHETIPKMAELAKFVSANGSTGKWHSGSGIFIEPDLIATASHVVAGVDKGLIIGRTHEGARFLTQVVKDDVYNDVALLRVVGKEVRDSVLTNEVFPLSKMASAQKGEMAIGFGFVGGELRATAGRVEDIGAASKLFNGPRESRTAAGEIVRIRMGVDGGMSGGPTVNLNGELLGLNSLGNPFATGLSPASKLKSLWQSLQNSSSVA